MADRLQDTWAKMPIFGMVNPYYYNEQHDPRRANNLRDAINGALILYALNDIDGLGKFTSKDAIHALSEKQSSSRIDEHLTYANGEPVMPSDFGMDIRAGINLLKKSNLVQPLDSVNEDGTTNPVYRTTSDARKLLATYPEIPFTVMPKKLIGKGCGMLVLSELLIGGTAGVEHILDIHAISGSSLSALGITAVVASISGTQIVPYIDAHRAYRTYEDHYGRPPAGPNLRLVK